MMGKPVWIAVPTFRRPAELRHLLETLAKLVQRQDVMVLVADNDGDAAEGAVVVEALRASGYPLPLTLLPVAEPGLCSVRNAICDVAMADPAMGAAFERFVRLEEELLQLLQSRLEEDRAMLAALRDEGDWAS